MRYNKTTHKKDVRRYRLDANKFWGSVDKRGEDDCWHWTRGRNTKGYGLVHVKSLPEDYERTGRMATQLTAHRVAYYLSRGDMNPADYICHTCDNPSCCNPAHLWLGSQQDNVNDMIAKGRAAWQ